MGNSHAITRDYILPSEITLGPRVQATPASGHIVLREGRLCLARQPVFGDREIGAYLVLLRQATGGEWEVLTLTYGEQSSRAGSYDLPGGKVDSEDCGLFGEFTCEAGWRAARRECSEEVGFANSIVAKPCGYLWLPAGSGVYSCAFAAMCVVDPGTPAPTQWEPRFASAQWVPLGAAFRAAARSRQACVGKSDIPIILRGVLHYIAGVTP